MEMMELHQSEKDTESLQSETDTELCQSEIKNYLYLK